MAVKSPFLDDGNQSNRPEDDFFLLNVSFVKEVLPKNFAEQFVAQYEKVIENKGPNEYLTDLFKKHNLEHLLKKDNLITQAL